MTGKSTVVNKKAKQKPAPMVCCGWTTEELVMLRFLELCVPSLDPANYGAMLIACQALCLARPNLDQGSIEKCLKQIFGDDYKLGLPIERRPKEMRSTPPATNAVTVDEAEP